MLMLKKTSPNRRYCRIMGNIKNRLFVGSDFPTKLDQLNNDYIFEGRIATVEKLNHQQKNVKRSKKNASMNVRRKDVAIEKNHNEAIMSERLNMTLMHESYNKVANKKVDFQEFAKMMTRNSTKKKIEKTLRGA